MHTLHKLLSKLKLTCRRLRDAGRGSAATGARGRQGQGAAVAAAAAGARLWAALHSAPAMLSPVSSPLGV